MRHIQRNYMTIVTPRSFLKKIIDKSNICAIIGIARACELFHTQQQGATHARQVVRLARVLIVAQVKNSVKMSACHRDAVFLCVAVRARATVSRTGAAS